MIVLEKIIKVFGKHLGNTVKLFRISSYDCWAIKFLMFSRLFLKIRRGRAFTLDEVIITLALTRKTTRGNLLNVNYKLRGVGGFRE